MRLLSSLGVLTSNMNTKVITFVLALAAIGTIATPPPRAAVEDLISALPGLASLGWNYQAYADSCNVPLTGISCGLRAVSTNGTISYVNYPMFLDLESINLGGSLPSTFNQLELQTVILRNVNISGNIPDSLFSSSFLLGLDLRNNLLSGSIPSTLSQATNLIELKLSNNSLSGTIPSNIYSIANLSVVSLENNRLVGPWPRRPSNGKKLSIVSLRNNVGPFCIYKEDTNTCVADTYTSCGCSTTLCNPSSNCSPSTTAPVSSSAVLEKFQLLSCLLLCILVLLYKL